ncbi:MAG: hypothetical protein HYY18_15065 [Planctomycetes bacterium]|nr:hypothetical protein [Planctomycetota bacterium]
MEELKAALKGGSEDAKREKVAACADCPHPKVAAALAPILVSGTDELRTAAAEALGRMDGLADAAKALHSALAPNEKHSKVLEALFAAIEGVNHPSSVPVCQKWVNDRNDLRDSEEVNGVLWAIDVLGGLKWKASVDALIAIWNKKKVSGRGGGTGGGYKEKCRQHAEAALRRLTAEAFGDVTLWEDWWKKNARNFNEDMSLK